MKAQKNMSLANSEINLMKFKSDKSNDWVANALFSTGVSASITLFISLILQY